MIFFDKKVNYPGSKRRLVKMTSKSKQVNKKSDHRYCYGPFFCWWMSVCLAYDDQHGSLMSAPPDGPVQLIPIKLLLMAVLKCSVITFKKQYLIIMETEEKGCSLKGQTCNKRLTKPFGFTHNMPVSFSLRNKMKMLTASTGKPHMRGRREKRGRVV